jgi:hypothetical protein
VNRTDLDVLHLAESAERRDMAAADASLDVLRQDAA